MILQSQIDYPSLWVGLINDHTTWDNTNQIDYDVDHLKNLSIKDPMFSHHTILNAFGERSYSQINLQTNGINANV